MDFNVMCGGSAKEQYMALRAMRTGLVLDQIAFYAPDVYAQEAIKVMLGLDQAEWTEDIVTGEVKVFNEPSAVSKAKLLFNYDHGIELEILTYLDGPHWHMPSPARPNPMPRNSFMSHIGFHVNDEPLPDLRWPIAQSMITTHHTNPAIAGRAYQYVIYDTKKLLGIDLKYIKRLR